MSGAPFPSREITVSGWRHLNELDELTVTCDPPFAEVRVTKTDDRAGVFQVRFTPQPDLPVGHHEFTLRMRGMGPGGKELRATGVKVFAKVVPDVEVYPPAVHLGALRVGEDAEYDVALRSRTGRPFELLEIDNVAEWLQIQEESIVDGGRQLRLRCRAEEPGVHVLKVHFEVKSEGAEASARIPLTVCYSCVAPAKAEKDSRESTSAGAVAPVER